MKIEIERKYIIKKVDENILSCFEGYTKSKITQIYLDSEKSITHRIRAREYFDKTIFTETKKTRIDKMSVHEDEREISKEEFCTLSQNIKSGTQKLEKVRYTISYLGKVIEIDVYPNWKETCIMETELDYEKEQVQIPDCINVVKEVTGDKRYSNASMSKSFPNEVI